MFELAVCALLTAFAPPVPSDPLEHMQVAGHGCRSMRLSLGAEELLWWNLPSRLCVSHLHRPYTSLKACLLPKSACGGPLCSAYIPLRGLHDVEN